MQSLKDVLAGHSFWIKLPMQLTYANALKGLNIYKMFYNPILGLVNLYGALWYIVILNVFLLFFPQQFLAQNIFKCIHNNPRK